MAGGRTVICNTLFAHLIWMVSGGIVLDMSPLEPSEGDTVTLTCTYIPESPPEHVFNKQSLWWSRLATSGHELTILPIEGKDNSFSLDDVFIEKEDGVVSILKINSFEETNTGQYSCTVRTALGSTESTNIVITYKKISPFTSMVSALLLMVAVCGICLLGLGFFIIEIHKRKRVSDPDISSEADDSFSEISNGSDVDMRELDAPPRYSRVMETDRIDPADIFSIRTSRISAVSSMLPPNYEEVLLDLVVEIDNKDGTDPPSYDEISSTDHSSGC